jgi:hypothetical protein
VFENQAFSKNCLSASLFKKGLSENPNNNMVGGSKGSTVLVQSFSKKA